MATIEVTKDNIDEIVTKNPLVILDFWADWCGPCKSLGPVLEKLEVDREKKDLEFVMANGQRITRSVGFAIVRVDKNFTVDEVVFAEKGDLLLLGARTLEGLSLTVDSRQKKLVASGPLPAA